MAFQLTREQAEVVNNRGGSLLVAAAAGSGKTRVLVERLLKRVEEDGLNIDQFLVITYTKAAAGELRGRIVEELGKRIAKDPTNRHLRRQSTLIYKTQISTIHSFCSQIIREQGHMLDLSADARLMDESEGAVLMAQVMEDVLEERYSHIRQEDDFAQLLDLLSTGRDDHTLIETAMDIYKKTQSHADGVGWMESQIDKFALNGITNIQGTLWGDLLLEQGMKQVVYWHKQLEYAVELCANDPKLLSGYTGSLLTTSSELEELVSAYNQGWDQVSECFPISFPRLGSVRDCESPESQAEVKAIRETCKKRMGKLEEQFSETSDQLLEGMRKTYPAVRGLFRLVLDFSERYQQCKAQRNLMDFSDLEHMAVKILTSGKKPSEFAVQVSKRYEEIMVDEYQDTNKVQNVIFTAISRNEENLFMVGDVKQSIYRFRLADPSIFLDKYRRFPSYENAVNPGPRRILLSQNFRSRKTVLEGVNFLFRNLMSKEFGEMEYGVNESLYHGAIMPGDDEDYPVELDVLDLSQTKESEEEHGKVPAGLPEARFVAKRIREMLDDEIKVADGMDDVRKATINDFAILLRSPGPMLGVYARALAEQGLVWEADSAVDFLDSNEGMVALSYLQIIDNPRQDVPLISVLRSPVWGFSADRLAEIRSADKKCDFYSALMENHDDDCVEFVQKLEQLRARATDVSCQQLLWEIYDGMNFFGIFGAMGNSELRRDNLLALSECAKQFEEFGHKGLFRFLSFLERLRANGGRLATSKVKGHSGVKILSIHKSKGLEFPIVFVAGLMRKFNRKDFQKPVLFHSEYGVGSRVLDGERMLLSPTVARRAVVTKLEQEMLAEELRVLYVAGTRAKEKLILVCGLGRGEKELESIAEHASCPVEPQALLDGKSMGQWVLMSAVCRPDAGDLVAQLPRAINPTSADCGPKWDIRWVDGGEFAEAPKSREKTSERDESEENYDTKDLKWLDWQYDHKNDVDIPSKLTATQLKGRHVDDEVGEVAPKPVKLATFHPPKFGEMDQPLTQAEKGTALHLLMQFISFDGMDQVSAVEKEIDRLISLEILSEKQGRAIDPERVAVFFNSEIGRDMMGSGTLQREFKFSLLVQAADYYSDVGQDEQVLLQGVVDCWYETKDGIVVLDFKTDRVGPDSVEERVNGYKPQLEVYGRALEEVTGRAVTRKILWFFAIDEGFEI